MEDGVFRNEMMKRGMEMMFSMMGASGEGSKKEGDPAKAKAG